jgi:hypothetical protein
VDQPGILSHSYQPVNTHPRFSEMIEMTIENIRRGSHQ